MRLFRSALHLILFRDYWSVFQQKVGWFIVAAICGLFVERKLAVPKTCWFVFVVSHLMASDRKRNIVSLKEDAYPLYHQLYNILMWKIYACSVHCFQEGLLICPLIFDLGYVTCCQAICAVFWLPWYIFKKKVRTYFMEDLRGIGFPIHTFDTKHCSLEFWHIFPCAAERESADIMRKQYSFKYLDMECLLCVIAEIKYFCDVGYQLVSLHYTFNWKFTSALQYTFWCAHDQKALQTDVTHRVWIRRNICKCN